METSISLILGLGVETLHSLDHKGERDIRYDQSDLYPAFVVSCLVLATVASAQDSQALLRIEDVP